MRPWMERTLLIGSALLAGAVIYALPPIPQDPAYHQFADQRRLLGVPSLWNVVTNLGFVAVGLAGLLRFRRGGCPGGLPELRAAYGLFFLGVALTGLGSGYYHLAPSNQRLLWDRLPMALSFTALLSALLGERVGALLGRRLLGPLVLFGQGSVLYWYATERAGSGDLRPYFLVQFLPLLILPLLLLGRPSSLPGSGYLWGALAAYTAAKLFEWGDVAVLGFLGQMSGHSLKHLAAAAAGLLILMALERRPAATPPPAGR